MSCDERSHLIDQTAVKQTHDDVIKWKHFPRHWHFVWGIHRSPVNSPHKGQWRGALMFSLICAWTHYWVNNRYAGDMRRHRAHYDVTVMSSMMHDIRLRWISLFWRGRNKRQAQNQKRYLQCNEIESTISTFTGFTLSDYGIYYSAIRCFKFHVIILCFSLSRFSFISIYWNRHYSNMAISLIWITGIPCARVEFIGHWRFVLTKCPLYGALKISLFLVWIRCWINCQITDVRDAMVLI